MKQSLKTLIIAIIIFGIWNAIYQGLYFIQESVSITPILSFLLVYLVIGASIWLFLSFKKLGLKIHWNLNKVPVQMIPSIFCTVLAIQVLGGWANSILEAFYPLNSSLNAAGSYIEYSLPMSIALTIVVGPIFEELYFRGLIFTKLKDNLNLNVAIVVQAILFALMHTNMSQLIPSFLFGCFAAYYYNRFNSIGLSILIHSLFNALLTIPKFLPEPILPWVYISFNIVGFVTLLVIIGDFVQKVLFKKKIIRVEPEQPAHAE